MISFKESLVISFIVILLKFFETELEYRYYKCPEYCGVEHKHIEDENLQGEIKGG